MYIEMNENLIINDASNENINSSEYNEDKDKKENIEENIEENNNLEHLNENIPLKYNKEGRNKERLIEILGNLKTNLENNENNDIEKIYKNYLDAKVDMETTIIKDKGKYCLYCIFYIIYPIFTIINLIGIFQIITVEKSITRVLKESTLRFFKITNGTNYTETNYDFFEDFYSESLNESVNYNLMMLFGFLGNMLLGSIGFSISSIILGLANLGSLFMIYNFNFVYDLTILNFIYLLVINIILIVGVGGSALLSQQVLLDSFLKYQKTKFTEENYVKRKELKFFFLVCLTTILGYFGKYILNLFFARFYIESDDKRPFFLFIIVIYGSSITISILIDFFFKCIIKQNQKNNKNIEKYKVCQICGFLIYSEEKANELKTSSSLPLEGPRLCCRVIEKCCNQSICDFLCCQIDENDDDKFHCCFSCCYNCNCCCKCCKCGKIDENDYDEQKNIFYCYCYQMKRKIKWFDMYMNNDTQIDLTKIMFNFFILQLITIAFDKIYNENIENEKNSYINILDLKNAIISCGIFVLIIILFFYITISWGRFVKEPDKNNKKEEDVEKISKDILQGATAILPFNSIFSLVFTIFYFTSLKDNLVTNINNSYIYIPILMNKFFYFTFSYYCIKTGEIEKGFDLVSGSTLISIYISIWNIILLIINKIIPINFLFFIQILPSSIICYFILSLLVKNLFCRGMFWRTCLYILFYFFACGGCWLFGCCCECCKCCACFETKEKFDEFCCNCGVFNKCCEHEELLKKCSEIQLQNKLFECFKKLRQKMKKRKKNDIV